MNDQKTPEQQADEMLKDTHTKYRYNFSTEELQAIRTIETMQIAFELGFREAFIRMTNAGLFQALERVERTPKSPEDKVVYDSRTGTFCVYEKNGK